MPTGFRGKIVLITGAAGGFGRAIAAAFAEQGAQLAMLDSNESGLRALAETFRAKGRPVSTAVADLSTQQGVVAGIEEVLAPFDGLVDMLVANVGVLVSGAFEEITTQELQFAFAINCFTHVWTCQSILPRMRERPGANIILMGSDQGSQPDVLLFPYAQAKAAIHSLGKLLAREYAPAGIRVNVVAPGMSRTPLVIALMEKLAREKYHTDSATAEQLELKERQIPLGRLGTPAEVAEAVLYLATAEFVTGQIHDISGGNIRGV